MSASVAPAEKKAEEAASIFSIFTRLNKKIGGHSIRRARDRDGETEIDEYDENQLMKNKKRAGIG